MYIRNSIQLLHERFVLKQTEKQNKLAFNQWIQLNTERIWISNRIKRIDQRSSIICKDSNDNFDWSKPFTKISSKKQFDALTNKSYEIDISDSEREDIFDSNSIDLIETSQQQKTNTQKSNEKYSLPYCKQEIMVPKIETVAKTSPSKQNNNIKQNYIRLNSHLNFPKLNQYQLTQSDHIFIANNQNLFVYEQNIILTPQFLKKMIIQLEQRAGKDIIIPRNKGWFIKFIQKQYRQLLNMPNFDQFANYLYNYWRSRRNQQKFPLYRPLWKPGPLDFSHTFAFKARQKETRVLRRNANRVIEQQILNELYEQFDLATKILARISQRQKLKIHQTELQIANFLNECADFVKETSILDEQHCEQPVNGLDQQEYLNKLKKQIQQIQKKQNPTAEQVSADLNAKVNAEQKLSIANFLATVIIEADEAGLTFNNIFPISSKSDSANKLSDDEQIPADVNRQYIEYKKKKSKSLFFSDWKNEGYNLRGNVIESFNKFMKNTEDMGCKLKTSHKNSKSLKKLG